VSTPALTPCYTNLSDQQAPTPLTFQYDTQQSELIIYRDADLDVSSPFDRINEIYNQDTNKGDQPLRRNATSHQMGTQSPHLGSRRSKRTRIEDEDETNVELESSNSQHSVGLENQPTPNKSGEPTSQQLKGSDIGQDDQASRPTVASSTRQRPDAKLPRRPSKSKYDTDDNWNRSVPNAIKPGHLSQGFSRHGYSSWGRAGKPTHPLPPVLAETASWRGIDISAAKRMLVVCQEEHVGLCSQTQLYEISDQASNILLVDILEGCLKISTLTNQVSQGRVPGLTAAGYKYRDSAHLTLLSSFPPFHTISTIARSRPLAFPVLFRASFPGPRLT
jgi:hypothetical protein